MNKSCIRGSCVLDKDINKCLHYDASRKACKDSIVECGMFDKNSIFINKHYVRKPRWYEKYYKPDSFIS